MGAGQQSCWQAKTLSHALLYASNQATPCDGFEAGVHVALSCCTAAASPNRVFCVCDAGQGGSATLIALGTDAAVDAFCSGKAVVGDDVSFSLGGSGEGLAPLRIV